MLIWFSMFSVVLGSVLGSVLGRRVRVFAPTGSFVYVEHRQHTGDTAESTDTDGVSVYGLLCQFLTHVKIYISKNHAAGVFRVARNDSEGLG